MKKLADYKNEDAIDLWADLLDPISIIVSDSGIRDSIKAKKPPVVLAKEILKAHKKEAIEILLRIDPEPVTALNIVIRLVDILMEFNNSAELQGFFESAGQTMAGVSSGNATANTGDAKK